MLSQTCARREFERSDVSPGAFPLVLLSPTSLSPVRRRGSSSAPGSRSLVVRAIAAELSIDRFETMSAHRLSLVGRRLRGPPPPSLLVQRAVSDRCRACSAPTSRALALTRPGSAPSEARHRRVFTDEPFAPRGVAAGARDQQRATDGPRQGGEGCPLKERPEPAPLQGGAVQRAARRRCRRELLKRTSLADPARWTSRKRAM
jgi:hypothetical protein